MANAVVQIRKLFEKQAERNQEGGGVLPTDYHGVWIGLGLFLVADALQTISTSIDNLGSEVRDCNDGVAQALGEMEVTISKVVDEMKDLPTRMPR